MSLRRRLVLSLLVLCSLGLVVAGVVTYASLRSFLYHQIDDALDSDHFAAEHPGASGGPPQPGGCPQVNVAPDVYVRVTRDGRTCVKPTSNLSGPPDRRGSDSDDRFRPGSPPKLAGRIDPSRPLQRFNTVATTGSGRYRVRVEEAPGGVQVVVARPLDPLDDTLHRLLLVELLVTAAVLAAIAVLGTWIVRRELHPLEDMGRTADKIAGGDLTRRVEPADERTEVGRLGLALNAMLHEIEASDQRLRRFVADASHELRTPLAAVRAYAELFGRGANRRPDDLARAMAGIGRESERMSLLVDDLLLLARLDEHRPLERKPVRLDEIAVEAVDAARAVDPGRPVELEVEPAVVLGDRARLRQIFDNLLANVRSHTPPGSAASVRVAPERGSAVIEVSDSGPGLSTDEANRVFERFYRADASRSRASGGVGLGLAIVEAVAHAHHGEVSAISEAGRGTTFRITIPLAP